MANGNFFTQPAPLKPREGWFTAEDIAQLQPIEGAENIVSVPAPEPNEVPWPQDDVSSEVSALRAIGQTGDAQLMEDNQANLWIKDSWIQVPQETPSLLGDAKDFVNKFQAEPQEEEETKTFWQSQAEEIWRLNYGDAWYDIKQLDKDTRSEFFAGRDADNISNIFDFDELPSHLQPKKWFGVILDDPISRSLFLRNRGQAGVGDSRSEAIYADIDNTANLAFQIDSLEERLANWEIRSNEEFEERAMDAFRAWFQQMWWESTAIKEDFTIEEASAFLEESLKKIDYIAVKRPNDAKPIMQRFAEGANQFKLDQNSTYQEFLDNQYLQHDITMWLVEDMQNTLASSRGVVQTFHWPVDWVFPGWVSSTDIDRATNKIIQKNERNMGWLFDTYNQLNETLWNNKKYLSEDDYNNNLNNLISYKENYLLPYAEAQAEVAGLQFNFLVSENLSAKEARERVNEYYQERWFTKGVESYLNTKLELNVEDFVGFTAIDTHGIYADEQALNLIITPYQKFSTIGKSISQDIAQQVKLETAWDKFFNFMNKSVTSLQINAFAPATSLLKNPYRAFQKGQYQDDFLDENTMTNMTEFMRDRYFTKSSSFASSDLWWVWTIDVDPSKVSTWDNTKENLADMWPDFAIAFGSMFAWSKWLSLWTKLSKAFWLSKTNRLLRPITAWLWRLTQLSTVIPADVIISAWIQESVGWIYRDIDAKVDTMFLWLFDALPILSKSIGDIKFLQMDSKLANSMLKWDKITLDELDQAKRVYNDMNNTLYNIVRKDPKRANTQLKSAYVRSKLTDFMNKWATTPQDVADIQAMVRQMNDPSQNVLDMLKYDRVDYIDQKTGKSLSWGMQLGPYSSFGSRAIPTDTVVLTKIPENLKAAWVKWVDQKFTRKQAEIVANSLGSKVEDVFARQSGNAYLIKDPKSLGIVDNRSLSSQLQSNIGRQLVAEDKKISDAFYDAVADRPEFEFKAAAMKWSWVYEQMFSSVKNLLC